jgi:antitoxin ParD1/3/4
MSRNTSIILGDHFAAFVEEQAQRLGALRAAIAEGEASGPSEPFDFDAFLAARRAGSG